MCIACGFLPCMQNRIRRKTDGVSIAVRLTGDESLMFNYMLVLMALVMLVQLCVGDKRRVRR